MKFSDMVDEVVEGTHPLTVIEGVLGADRSDDIDSFEAKAVAFQELAGSIQQYNGYVGPDWITQMADQIRGTSPDGINELVSMAERNRGQYLDSARIDAGGSFDMWDNILRGLIAVSTDQVAPQV